MAQGRPGRSFDELAGYYREQIVGGVLRLGARFPSLRQLGELHGIGPTTAGRVHAALISEGLLVHRAGTGTFVTSPPSLPSPRTPDPLRTAAERIIAAYDQWVDPHKPPSLAVAVAELRDALG